MEQHSAIIALSALAHDARLSIFRMLVVAGSEGLGAGMIAECMEIPKATLSFHLKELNRAGLIESTRDGRAITYAMRPDGIRSLLAFLTQDCCEGRPELCSFPSDCC
ncbi:MAG: metalloregulator ArsR/SmtB family transcription factor [Verrucomicrobia bacterium]|nr:metalloregulator ArsR/SmtB family transcription factor [Verrucomicrobiota bacterium]